MPGTEDLKMLAEADPETTIQTNKHYACRAARGTLALCWGTLSNIYATPTLAVTLLLVVVITSDM